MLVPFRFGSVLVAVPCFREASKEESLKFELTVILNFGQNSESEFVFKRIIGIGIRMNNFFKINSRDSRNSDDNDDDSPEFKNSSCTFF